MKIIIAVTLFIVLRWNAADGKPSRLKQDEMDLLRSFGYENAEISKKLIENGTNAEIVDLKGRTPMHLASENGWYEVVRLLIDRGYTNQIQVRDEDSLIPLEYAVENGHLNVTELLIKSGSDVNHRGGNLWTPLHSASWEGHVDIMRLLIQKGSDVHATALYFDKPIHLTALRGKVNATRLLIQSGSYVDPRDTTNETPLHIAMEYGHKDVAQVLLLNGANIHAKNDRSQTPRDLALRKGYATKLDLAVENSEAEELSKKATAAAYILLKAYCASIFFRPC